jgi:hypothetical protein
VRSLFARAGADYPSLRALIEAAEPNALESARGEREVA